MDLESYKDVVETLAEWSAKIQILTPAFICKDIIVRGNTDGVPTAPFIGGVGLSLLFVKYGYIINDFAMISASKFSSVACFVYLVIYLCYCSKKVEILKSVFKILFIIGALCVYALVDEENLSNSFGIITTAAWLIYISVPLFNLKKIIKERDTRELVLPIILNGTINSTLWLLYGTIIKNAFLQFQNCVVLGLYVVELALYIVFRASKVRK